MSIERFSLNPRVKVRTRGAPDPDGRAVVYWMQRAQRAYDNPALETAIAIGNRLGKPVVAFLGLNPFVERANLRHYQFLAEGLGDIAEGCWRRRVTFVLKRYPRHRLLPFLEQVRPAIVIGDENPLRQMERWRERVAETIKVPFWTVDADVIVPSQLIETEQYAARTLRPRIHRHLDRFLVKDGDSVATVEWPPSVKLTSLPASEDILDDLLIDGSAAPVPQARGGTSQGRRRLDEFVAHALPRYHDDRNHPELDGTSALSPYLHFGHLGPREVALAIKKARAPAAARDAYLEQLIVRRELAINFVRYNEAYDRLEGCEAWARQTLRRHEHDPRSHRYTAAEFEAAATHDPLWNAAQRQMLATGWMHGYLRMYWAKKILEWSPNAGEAMQTAIELNDRYQLDGRDPNGYTNIAWAIGGKHDHPWPSRPIYGTIRSMSFASTRRKFDVRAYVERYGTSEDIDALGRMSRR